MGEAGLEDFGDEVFEQHTAQGGPGLKFAKQRIGQIEDGVTGGANSDCFWRLKSHLR